MEAMDLGGAKLFKQMLDRDRQEAMIGRVREVVARAPLFHPETASGKKMSVRMTSCGRVGWVTDRRGYRYEPRHPSGVEWPEIPNEVLRIWDQVAGCGVRPDSCLVNFYGEGAKMGMHQDRDEGDFGFPVVSISLGDEALFRIGSATRGGKTQSAWLSSGDVLVLGGEARLAYHGIDRLRFGSSDLLRDHGRINLTMRVVR